MEGKEVEEKYFEIHPDVVILDLNIPGKNGLDIINDLTKKEIRPKQNIIVISGDISYRANLTNVAKVKWIFSKPFEIEKLIKVIRDTIEKKVIIDELNCVADELLSKLEIPLSKGRKVLKIAILIAYFKPSLLIKNEMLMKAVAQKENYNNAKSVRSTIDKTIERAFNRTQNKSVYNIINQYYREKMTTKEFIGSCVLYIRKSVKND